MTTETPVALNAQQTQLLDIWVECLRAVIGQVAGSPVTVEPSGEEEPAPAKESELDKPTPCMVITASKAVQGDMAIVTSQAGALAMAQILVSDPPDPSASFDQDRRDAFEELLRQVLGQVATSLKKAAGGEVEVKPSGSEVPKWAGTSHQEIRITVEKFEPIQLSLMASPEFLKSFHERTTTQEASAQKAAAPTAASPDAKAEPVSTFSGGRSSNLELLLDIKLDATIRFGQKHMLLREILELHPGTAVTLDRHVQEPVELLVGGRVVAQGDVVIVDGNYGIRITEILSPLQRIESLGK